MNRDTEGSFILLKGLLMVNRLIVVEYQGLPAFLKSFFLSNLKVSPLRPLSPLLSVLEVCSTTLVFINSPTVQVLTQTTITP